MKQDVTVIEKLVCDAPALFPKMSSEQCERETQEADRFIEGHHTHGGGVHHICPPCLDVVSFTPLAELRDSSYEIRYTHIGF